MQSKKIAFIGGGNMAFSLIGGLIKTGFPEKNIWVSDPSQVCLNRLKETFDVHTTTQNQEAIQDADIILFAVKPQVIDVVLKEIAPFIRTKSALIISILAGVKVALFESFLGNDIAIVRTMPNTPALIRCGVTSLYANSKTSSTQKKIAENIMKAVGVILWLESEDQLNATTAVAGSGPAYFFMVIEAMQKAAVSLGLTKEQSKLLVLQTAFGSAKMALESQEDVVELRRKVTSPQGTTESAIKFLEQENLFLIFENAIKAACDRSKELAEIVPQSIGSES